jgi:hypothetical protein
MKIKNTLKRNTLFLKNRSGNLGPLANSLNSNNTKQLETVLW